MWSEVLARFSKFPAQQRVAEVLLEHGFQVNSAGEVVSGTIRIPDTEISRAAKVDRRAVDEATATILGDEMLRRFFSNLKTLLFLRDVAPFLGLGVIVITPEDAAQIGIIEEVAETVAASGVRIRQAVTDDPYFIDEPKLTIICDTRVPGSLVDELLQLGSVKGVSIF
ncbi:MAG TPA: amino acid-binding protein [Candidatus Bathyarchaeia archaeon]|nr:amino acid-binding protein [Candidatus Bathyarchaeia archaeon]